jgi:hypothetical protein
MRRLLLSAAAGVAALTLSPAAAEASGWRWLEKLSGPGDFFGFQADIKIYCVYDDKAPAPSDAEIDKAPGVSIPCIHKRGNKRGENGKKHSNYRLNLEERRHASGISVGYLRAASNDLIYDETIDLSDRTVQVVTLEAFHDRRFRGFQRIDYGVAVGANLFIGPAGHRLWRASIEPRVTLKLFDLTQRDHYVGTFNVRIGALWFPGGFKDTDFGAVPGTYDSGVEVGPSVRFIFDFDENPFKNRR